MKVVFVCLVLAVAVTVTSARTPKTKVEIAFEKYGLTKYVKVPPKLFTTAEYSGHIFVNLGNELTPAQVSEVPRKSFPGDKESYYTVIFVDVNYSRNPGIQFLHGLIVNIPGGQVEKGEIVSDYIPPRPAVGTGYHNYITLAYKQPRMIDADQINELKSYSGIAHPETFSLREYVEKNCLGNPYSGNFFKVKCDSQTLSCIKH